MNRRQFVATVGAATAVAAAASVLEPDWASAEPRPDPESTRAPAEVDGRYLDTLTRVNDLQVPNTLSSYQQQIDGGSSPRALAQSALRLVTAYANPRGARFHDGDLLGPVNTLLGALATRQNPSGLYDIGNLDSPPDTSFVISDLGLAYDVLLGDDQAETTGVRGKYGAIMRKSARALIEGGVHTPNHRWEIARRWLTSTTCGRAEPSRRGSTTGWARVSTKIVKVSTASAAPTTPPR